jgi:hypothetical protein
MVPRAVVLLTLLLPACQSTNSLSTVEIRQQEHQLVVSESSIQEVSSVPSCAKKDLMTKFLAKTFNERPLLKGTSTDGSILTIYAGPNGAWTLTKIVNDITCIVAGGTGLKVLKSEKGPII